MSLAPGTTLGPYRIDALIGVGGMGEVYRATDPRIPRSVAIKVLPTQVGDDSARRARFEREARTIGSLNHPNICTLFDVGRVRAEGPSAGQGREVEFLVLELVQGETLAKRLERGKVQLDDALRYGMEISSALDRAHRQGIVHRDLKPANVMITKAGVKLLDFGLAKFKPGPASGESALPTRPADGTAEGTILGTLQYMSPEQVEGHDADARSDIFAFGAVLYEMVTGRRAFDGRSQASLIGAILRDEPPAMVTLQPLAPVTLDRIVQTCLEKDPDDRWQAAADVTRGLRWIADESKSGVPSVVPPSDVTTSAAAIGDRTARSFQSRLTLIGLIAAVAVILTAVSLGYVYWRGARAATPPRMARLQLVPPPGVRIAVSGAQSILAISPDGQWVAFQGGSDDANRRGVYLRSIAELEARFVQGSQGGSDPFFSPDSQWLGFAADGRMQKIPVSGGQPETICRCVPSGLLRGASWGDDGQIVFSAGRELLRVPADGGEPTALTKPEAGTLHYWPQVLPGSQAVVFTLHQGNTDKWRKIAVLSIKTGNVQVLSSLRGTHPRYLPSGHLVYARLGTLYAAAFDVRHPEAVGLPQPILEDVYGYSGGSGYTAFDVASSPTSSGSLVYVPGAERLEEGELVWLDRQGNAVPAVQGRKPYDPCRASISPSGDLLAAVIRTTLEDQDLWVHDIGPGDWKRLTEGYEAECPIWSRDGKWIVFTSFRTGHGKLFRVPGDASRPPEPLTTGVNWDYAGSFSPDGKIIFFMRQVGAAQWDLMTLRIDSPGADPESFLATPVLEAWPAVSPNGRWVAYESNETDSRQVHVRPYPEGEPRWTVSAMGGFTPQWSLDGRELFYRRGLELWSVPVEAGAAFRHGVPQRLFTVDFLPSAWDNKLAATPDGQRFLAFRFPPRQRIERLPVYAPDWMEQVREALRR